ncbi:MAG: hypothetical protein ACKOBW_07100 [Planctomycetota bacterium]
MGLMDWIALWNDRKSPHRLPNLAVAIANRSLDGVWPLVANRVGDLSTHELRGYVRARGRSILRTQLQQVVDAQVGLNSTARAQLFQLASGKLAQLINIRYQSLAPRETSRRLAA